MDLFKTILKPSTKTEYVEESIRTAILVGDLPTGSKITEKQIRESLQVSSSPVREAFVRLEVEGLLTKTAHSGTKVTPLSIEDLEEAYFVQAHLQSTAVKICIQKLSEGDIQKAEKLNNEMKNMLERTIDVKKMRVANYKFHMLLCGVNVYPWFTRIISGLWIRFPTQVIWADPNRVMESIMQHDEIIMAVKNRNATTASSLMRKHLLISMQTLFKNKIVDEIFKDQIM